MLDLVAFYNKIISLLCEGRVVDIYLDFSQVLILFSITHSWTN